jgi:hypothetical protein
MRARLFLAIAAVGVCILHTGCSDSNELLSADPESPIRVIGSAMAAGDVNADGIADLLIVVDQRLMVFFGGPNRTWNEPDSQTDLASKASEIALADVNEDGKPDVVLADHDSYEVAVWLGHEFRRYR